ncbi:phosphoadenylyl-sulfate reductase [Sphingomonas sanguinis]|jgi:phosphoadenosine phosphosulfate reductase|uniref:Adenosine 5'-phosphosulfate reductase n=1 Tax=Sphingomonas sanguinis TaxID=33051 RepID=A0A7Y7URF4_9SPHN|nr:phosphoadenylyl-sulfate reductase [Sphingomonas sanguinis]MBZ6381975.1 phosphoadenylyl-sulfate reductase [Sphingomonas sanguinis]NNG50740.1 phosphoadenylyl-sulfate reductase [Sphingomonas sanguinis]NNG52531.1 phosphoadenylyl-sulfate reductase [Sphingomonas sanguinis]NVP31275.1 phosphoadenylyl-sulfate reductase [Sphingomonas sanguinis]
MAERALDRIDVRPAYTAEDAAAYEARFAGVPAPDMLRTLLTGELHGQIAAVSSFGAESAVLLHMVAQADQATPVVFTDTLKMFPETLAYRDTLVERLGLLDVRVIQPDPALLAAKDPDGIRHGYDPDGCCELRKVEPLARGLAPFEAWISGRKGFQAGTRRALPRFEVEKGRLKLNPLADWDKAALDGYFAEHDLPRHPLEAQGYLSIGCAPCTSKVKPGEDPRAGRWRGFDKVECGIHRPIPAS